MNRRAFLAGAAGIGAALSGCTSVLGSDAEFDIGMRASAFVPATFETTVGETVIWYNDNDRPHTVTAYDEMIPEDAEFFASGDFSATKPAKRGYERNFGGAIYPGESYEHTFEVPGEYDYFCVPHVAGGMVGTIVVEE